MAKRGIIQLVSLLKTKMPVAVVRTFLWPLTLTILLSLLTVFVLYIRKEMRQQIEQVTRVSSGNSNIETVSESSSALQKRAEELISFLGLKPDEFLDLWSPLGPRETYFLPPLDHVYYRLPIEKQLRMRGEFASNLSVALLDQRAKKVSNLPMERRMEIGYLLFDLVYPPLETQKHVLYDESLQALLETALGENGKISEARISRKNISIKASLGNADFLLRFRLSKDKESSVAFELETLRINELGLDSLADKLLAVGAVTVVRAFSDSKVEKVQELLERRIEFAKLEDGYAEIGLRRCGVDVRSKGLVRTISAISARNDPGVNASVAFSTKPRGFYYVINSTGDWLYLFDELLGGRGWCRVRDVEKLVDGKWVSVASK